MYRTADQFVFSPSDLNHFLECEHVIQLERARQAGEWRGRREAHADLLAQKGAEHEAAQRACFVRQGRTVVDIDAATGPDTPWADAAARTLTAMRAGAEVIYQGVFVDEGWQGISDFLVRIDEPSALGSWSYEAWDTKLARHSRPYFVLQLCFYTEQLARVQGRTPDWMTVVLGTGQQERLRYREFEAYYRAVRRRFVTSALADGNTYPYPVTHCALCEYDDRCRARRAADDHLSGVAGIRRQQVERLQQAGVLRIADLAVLDGGRSLGIGAVALSRLRHQARLQDGFRQTGQHRFDVLRDTGASGFRLLPRPSEGDIFFDMEGDPYFHASRGLEYLFGAVTSDGYRAFWALDAGEEKRAFEQFVDFVHDRLQRYPDLHIYHYAPYETAALKRLMSEHATREEALDDLLRRELFVDLYQVVRQSVRISHPSYSIKKVRTFFMKDAGRGVVSDGGDSILQFERWRATGDRSLLEGIERYNEEDCVSTRELRDWLLELRATLVQTADDLPWKEVLTPEVRPERAAEDAATSGRREALLARGADPALRVCADLLNYHRREAKPEYWAYFERRRKSPEDLLEDTYAIASLEPAGPEPTVVARSRVHTLQFPPQEFKLGADPKAQLEDPFRLASAGTIEWLDAQNGRLGLKRGARRDEPLPQALIAGPPLDTRVQRAAIARVADAFIAVAGRYGAIADLLALRPPRIRGLAAGESIHAPDLASQVEVVTALDESYLVIQGPPGTGKTWTGARLIVSLVAAGRRIGVTATSHKAINNLLREVERAASEAGVAISGLKKGGGADAFGGGVIRDTDSNEACETAEVAILGGTSWLFARPQMDGRLDYLFVDEAGQVSLADAVAMGTSARNLVFLGDPQQLPHVRQGVHPGASGASVLQYLLDGSDTVPASRGIFLACSWRMHPDVCAFVSELSYASRLRSAEGRERLRIHSPGLAGSGLRFLPVAHTGNAQQSLEEAAAIAEAIGSLLTGGSFTDTTGRTRPLTTADILVVAPYNMQVRTLADALPSGIEVGTVDRFQGREAPVVFFSMASSTGADVPRGLEFLFSRNRFNVAISRAQAMAVVVCSPRLLETRCRSVEQMRLVNALCRFAEAAPVVPDRSPYGSGG